MALIDLDWVATYPPALRGVLIRSSMMGTYGELDGDTAAGRRRWLMPWRAWFDEAGARQLLLTPAQEARVRELLDWGERSLAALPGAGPAGPAGAG